MRFFLNILLLLFSFECCCSQEILSPLPQARFITSFPFQQYSGSVMIIKAKLNNIPDSLNFILDTGSGGISLDSSTCAEFNLPAIPTDTTIKGLGGSHKVCFVFKQKLQLPGLAIDNLDFHVNDYDVLSSVYGEKIDGIIGYSFFSRYIAKVNFDSSKIEVYSPGEIEYPRGGTMLRPAFSTLPILNLNFKDRKKTNFNFYFDTGAGLCFLMSENYAKDSSILLSRRKPVMTQAEGMGGRLQMQLTVIKMLQVGHYKFRNVPTYIYKDDYNVTSYPYIGGLIGNDLLRRFNMIINYPKREIHLLPNKHFNDPFDYAYTGLAIYYIDGTIVVEDIIPGSPAEKAGLIKGDILVGVSTNFSNNITQYKNILQSAADEIHLFIRRGKDLHQLVLRPKSIL